MKISLWLSFLCSLFLIACGGDSSTSANNSDIGENSSKSSSSSAKLSSSSVAKSSSSRKTVSSSSWNEKFVTDSRDGKKYRTVKIGNQTWMAENLNYETANSYCYNDTASYCSKYGRLYTWAAAMDSAGTWSSNGKGCGYDRECSPTYPLRGVCPSGWHLPTQKEWNALFAAVSGDSTVGKVLKSASGWSNNGNGTDAFSFSALPAGYMYYEGGFNNEGFNTFFWSSTELSSYNANYVGLFYNDVNAKLHYSFKFCGVSVRCLKD